MKLIKCKSCGLEAEHAGKGFCKRCYRKQYKSPMIICKNCGKERRHKAFGLCGTCHIKINHYDTNKAYNYMKWHNIPLELYRKKTKSCEICGFDKVVDLHHLDMNKKNNSKENLVGLCPNHHKMLHNYRFSKEIVILLAKNGFKAKISVL
ncbi:MAG: hypothetical protein QME12_04715 [Nanoarchaeota archaeon]|nr:hypothetical protein [Nanoarchaeota archaeon]